MKDNDGKRLYTTVKKIKEVESSDPNITTRDLLKRVFNLPNDASQSELILKVGQLINLIKRVETICTLMGLESGAHSLKFLEQAFDINNFDQRWQDCSSRAKSQDLYLSFLETIAYTIEKKNDLPKLIEADELNRIKDDIYLKIDEIKGSDIESAIKEKLIDILFDFLKVVDEYLVGGSQSIVEISDTSMLKLLQIFNKEQALEARKVIKSVASFIKDLYILCGFATSCLPVLLNSSADLVIPLIHELSPQISGLLSPGIDGFKEGKELVSQGKQ
jgi:hypothetical protein